MTSAWGGDPGPEPRFPSDGGEEPAAAADPLIIDTSTAIDQLGVDVGVSPEQAGYLLSAVWGICHLAVRWTGGPDDSFQPSPRELAAQSRPVASVLNRYEPVAKLAQQSDFIGAALLLGAYAVGEVKQVGDYRSGLRPEEWQPSEADDVAAPGEELLAGRPRWQPKPPPPMPPSP